VNDKLVLLLSALFDSGSNANSMEWWPFASATLAAFLSGLFLFWAVRFFNRKDKQVEEDRRALKSELASFGLKIESEREERRNDIAVEGRIRREQLDNLGRDISDIREEINYDYGQRNLPRPQWRKSPKD
jgi:hypothetical protein